jgi:hypothetical protein
MATARSKSSAPVTDEQAHEAMERVRAYRRGEPGITHGQAMTAGRVISRYLKEQDRLQREQKQRGS